MAWVFKGKREIVCDEICTHNHLVMNSVIKSISVQYTVNVEKQISNQEEIYQDFYINGVKFNLYCDWVGCYIQTYSSEGEQILSTIKQRLEQI